MNKLFIALTILCLSFQVQAANISELTTSNCFGSNTKAISEILPIFYYMVGFTLGLSVLKLILKKNMKNKDENIKAP